MRAEIGRALTGEVEAKRLAKNKKEQTGAATFSKVLKVIRPTLESFFREEDQRESLLKTFETTPVPLTDGPFVGQLIKQAFPFSVRILEFVKERYIEILQLREPIPPGGYRLVRVDSRSRLEREEGPTTTGGTDLVVEAPLQGIPAIFPSKASTHIRIFPPEGLRFREFGIETKAHSGAQGDQVFEKAGRTWARHTWKRSLWTANELVICGVLAVLFSLVFPLVLAWILILEFGLLALFSAVCPTSSEHTNPICWHPQRTTKGFDAWASDFIVVSEPNRKLVERAPLRIATQDSGLTYVVFTPMPTGEHLVRVAFCLPRVLDRAPYLLASLVWAVIYLSSIGFVFGAILDSSSILFIYSAKLHGLFTQSRDFLGSLMLPMVGIGISMSITSLIHYINRTPSQKLLLRASMTLVLFAIAGAVLLPMILLALT